MNVSLRKIFLLALLLPPFYISPSNAQTFDVDTPDDVADAQVSDGVCASASGFCSLRAAVQTANALGGRHTINLRGGTYIMKLSGADDNAVAGDLDITTDITVNGQPNATVLDANHVDRWFHVLGYGRLTLQDLTIKNGRPYDNSAYGTGFKGGALYIGYGASADVNNCVFQDNDAGNATVSGVGKGGAIFNQGILHVREGGFARNLTSTSTPVVGAGGAIYSETQVFLEGTSAKPLRFLDNQGENGGAVASVGWLTVAHAEFKNNRAANDGGAIEARWALVLSDVVIQGNSASARGGGVSGMLNHVLVDSVSFNGNSAASGGGISASCAQYNYASEQPNFFFSNVRFSNNQATKQSGSPGFRNNGGGAAFFNSDYAPCQFTQPNPDNWVNLTNVEFSSNTSDGDGGALYAEEVWVKFDKGLLASNSSTVGNGGAIAASIAEISLANVTVYDNTAFGEGGALYSTWGYLVGVPHASKFILLNTTLNGNHAHQGATPVTNSIAMESGEVKFENSIITQATNDSTNLNCVKIAGNAKFTSQGYNTSSDSSCGLTQSSDNRDTAVDFTQISSADGSFLALQPATRLLANITTCPLRDQRNYKHPAASCAQGAVDEDGVAPRQDSLRFGAARYEIEEDTKSGYSRNPNKLQVVVQRIGNGDGNARVYCFSPLIADNTANSIHILRGEGAQHRLNILTWQEGDTGEKSCEYKTVPNDKFEADRVSNHYLHMASMGQALGDPSVTAITIKDNDFTPGQLNYGFAGSEVGENVGKATLSVTRTANNSVTLNGTVQVDYRAVDDTARNGVDYVLAAGTLTFLEDTTAESQALIIDIPITDDTVWTGDRRFKIELSNARIVGIDQPQRQPEIATSYSNTLYILENEVRRPGNVSISLGAVSYDEAAGVIDVHVLRNNGSDGVLTVVLSATPDSADASDYTFTHQTVTFAHGDDAEKIVRIPLIDNDILESPEVFYIGYTVGDGSRTLNYPRAKSVTITDDSDRKPGAIRFELNQTSVNEGEAAHVKLIREGGSDGEVTVTVMVGAGSSAAKGADFTDVSETVVTFANGETEKTLEIQALNDEFAEPSEDVVLELSRPTNGATLAATNIVTVVSILDVAPPAKPVEAADGGSSGKSSRGALSIFELAIPLLMIMGALRRRNRL